MNGAHTAILLFLHDRGLPTCRSRRNWRRRAGPSPAVPTSTAKAYHAESEAPIEESAAPPLTCRRRALDHDKVDRTTRPVIVENSDRQPSRPPGERVQVGPALV